MKSNFVGFRTAVLVAAILNVFVACLRADHAQRTATWRRWNVMSAAFLIPH
ncbi:MAG TPA: hypothetical protein VFZ59_12320 [Verrucomicrobiae bacterium]|nr:hypothetical protein [Verrucomicrobiae bacterium]